MGASGLAGQTGDQVRREFKFIFVNLNYRLFWLVWGHLHGKVI